MPKLHDDRKPLWLTLLLCHLTLLAGLLAWVGWQIRPVQMHDLQLAGGEKLKCVSYAPYHRPGQTPFDPELRISREQIHADLSALASITDCVRLYSVNQGLEQVPEIARQAGVQVLLGAWIGYDRDKNAAELDRAIELANANSDVVRALIVGNEVLLRRERSEDEMRALIREAKSRARVPVTYADVWEFWTRHDSLAQEVNFVTVHILPFWEDEPVNIEDALEHVAATRRHVGEHFAGKHILIGETGWPSQGRQREESRPSQVNQARYVREFVHQAHAQGWDYNLIEAIDQPWKRRLEGTVGGYWGMLDASTLEPKFPFAGPVAERSGLGSVIAGLAAGAAAGLLLSLGTAWGGSLRRAALIVLGATTGLIAVLHAEHAHLAYRDVLEWTVLGGVALLAILFAASFAAWRGNEIPSAEQAWRTLRQPSTSFWPDGALGLLRGLLLFAAAIAALLLFVNARYRDFPTLLYLGPAALLGALGRAQAAHGRAERICAAIIAVSVIGRWLTEPANPQAIAWLATGLLLALPPIARSLPGAGKHQQ
ncbi:beta-1,6-glucan synthase [Thauera sp.]|uniref:glycoside hydrolase family 17 protein n=1 Tax=Thauera sp. TaxID=1905334 RepID=UPI0039E217B1